MNPYEEHARAKKVSRLSEAVDAAATESLGPGAPHTRAQQIARAMLDLWSEQDWEKLATAAGVRVPSATTKRILRELYLDRARSQPHRCRRGHRACYSSYCEGTE